MSHATQLKKFKANWKKAAQRDPKSFSGSELEDGRYIARIEAMNIDNSISSGRLQLMTEFEIVEGPEAGQTVRSYDGLETEDGLFFLMRKLAKLGQEVPEDITDVEPVCEKIEKEKPVVRIRLRTKGEYQNIYIDKLIGHAQEVAEEGAPDEVAAEKESSEGIDVGDTVTITVKGKETKATVTKLLDDDTFKARLPDGKEKLITMDQLVTEEKEKSEGDDDVVDLSVDENVRVLVKGKKATVTVTEIVDDESFKAKGKDGKVKTYTVDQLVLEE